MNKRIPVIIVSGFLGSGKTTFLRYLLKNSNKKYGLLINEFGDVGIDGDLIKTCSSCETNLDECVIELNNGCICCTVQDDFIPSIKTLLKYNGHIEGIIIETSGLALPMPLLTALNWPELRMSVYLDLVICLVNGESMLEGSPINNFGEINNQYQETQIIDHKTSFKELFEDQLEVSDLVLISRSDILKDDEFDFIKETVTKKINKNVPVIKCLNGEINLDIIDSDLQKHNSHKLIKKESHHNNSYAHDHDHDHEHFEIFSHSFKCNYFLEKKDFDEEITKIIKDLSILRIKGRIWVPNKVLPLQIQIVGSKVNSWFEEAPIDCWRPKQGGLEIIMIGYKKEAFKIIENKITEKFNILDDPN